MALLMAEGPEKSMAQQNFRIWRKYYTFRIDETVENPLAVINPDYPLPDSAPEHFLAGQASANYFRLSHRRLGETTGTE